MKFSEFPYSRPDTDSLLARFGALVEQLKQSKSAAEAVATLHEFNQFEEEVDTVCTIAHVRNTIDTRDEFYEKECEFGDQLMPVLTEKLQEFSLALLALPFRAELEKELGSLLFLNCELELKGFSPEIIPLMQEENLLCSQYQKLYASAQLPFMGKTLTISQLGPYKQDPDRAVRKAAYETEGGFFDEHRAEFDELFDKLVKNRTEQAHRLGLKDFVELGYIRRQRNCYGPEAVAAFRRQVVEDIVPVVKKIKANQAKRISISDLKLYDDGYAFPDGNPIPQGTPDEILAAGRKMYTEMSTETAEFIKMMFDQELFDVLAKEGKAPGGYCTQLASYNVPFIFSNFNGTAADVDVLTHEAGHAFAFSMARKQGLLLQTAQPTMEGCETHSMSMEFLTEPWHHLFFGPQTAKYDLSHAEDALVFLPYGCEIDHFQEICYSKPELTPEERNAEWGKLEKLYRPYIDSEGMPFYGRSAGWQRQLHVYLYPFYYVDYCMAQTMAFQIWLASMKNRPAAWETYLSFVKLGGTKTFTDLIKAVGLDSPLEDGCLKKIASEIEVWLGEHAI